MTARGHSLLELVTALALLALLLAGLARWGGAAALALARTRDALAAQAALRRGLQALEDQVQGLGFEVPLGPRRGPAPEAGPDRLTWAEDQVLPASARLAEALPGPDPACLVLAAGRRLRLEPGDLLLVEDADWEALRVARPAELHPGRAGPVPVTPLEGPLARPHGAGTPVEAVRPGSQVQMRRAWPPGEPGPCLVRLEAPAGSRPDWDRLAGHRGGPARLLAPRITRFRVDRPGPGLVRIDLEAEGPAGLCRRRASLVLAPRNGL